MISNHNLYFIWVFYEEKLFIPHPVHDQCPEPVLQSILALGLCLLAGFFAMDRRQMRIYKSLISGELLHKSINKYDVGSQSFDLIKPLFIE